MGAGAALESAGRAAYAASEVVQKPGPETLTLLLSSTSSVPIPSTRGRRKG